MPGPLNWQPKVSKPASQSVPWAYVPPGALEWKGHDPGTACDLCPSKEVVGKCFLCSRRLCKKDERPFEHPTAGIIRLCPDCARTQRIFKAEDALKKSDLRPWEGFNSGHWKGDHR